MPSRARLASLGLTEWYELGNAVVLTNDIANANITPNKLTNVFTSNIIENGNTLVGNVYFTNARVVAALTGGNGIDIFANGLITANANAELTFTDVITSSLTVNNTATANVLRANTVDSLNWANLYASNVIESGNTTTGNVFFSNARAIAALTAGENITIEANGLVVGVVQSFSGNTDSVPEGVANLYFTNDRVIAALTAGENIVIESNGLVAVNTNPTFNDLTVNGNLTIDGNVTYLYVQNLEVTDNMIYLNANSNISNPDLGWAGNYNDGVYRHAGVFRDADDGIFKFFDEYEPEPDANIYIDTANATFHLANVQATTFFGNLEGNVANISTDWIPEGANLYFTNARAIGSLTAGDGITIEANGLVIGAGTYTDADALAAVQDNITTDNVIEGSNLYYTNARVRDYIVDTITTGDITESGNTDTGNVYFTNNRAVSAFTGGVGITIEANGLIISSGEASTFTGTTDGVAEGIGNLYFTVDRAISAVRGNISTSNVIEGSNLYFTNTRAIGSLTAGEGITIEANGLVISEAAGVIVLNSSETFAGDGSSNTFTMAAAVDNPEDILVMLNGVTLIPSTDYTVNATSLVFTTVPMNQSNIEVRFFGNGDAVIDSRGFFSKSINGSYGGAVIGTGDVVVTAPENVRYIVHSIYVTNINDTGGNVALTAQLQQNGTPQDNTNVYIANVVSIIAGSSLDMLSKPHVLEPGDQLWLQALNNGVAADSNLHAYVTFESRNDVSYFSNGRNFDDLDTHMLLDSGGSGAVIEAVRLSNYGGGAANVTVRWTDASNVTQGYFCYNKTVEPSEYIELIDNPKRIPPGGRILATASATNRIAVLVSGRTT